MMRLLDTTSLRLKTFAGPPARYAILSHTWGTDEVLFQDIEAADTTWRHKIGGPKLLASARKAREAGFDLLWVDNCCINKNSSSELSESLNSMFQWYAQATVCIAFLSDIEGIHQLQSCRWFTRGFTLQELLAPVKVHFFNSDWQYLGSRSELATDISLATGINEEALRESVAGRVARWSVYERMRWASRRVTSKEEDMAYCLLGLFDVNMALVYGEGLTRAFRRLQEEILDRSNSRQSNDQSIIFHHGPYAMAQGPQDFWADLKIVRRPEVNLDRLDIEKTVGLGRYQARSTLLTQSKISLDKTGLNVTGTVCEVNSGTEALVILDLEVKESGMLGLRPALRLSRSRHEWTRAQDARCLVLPGGGNGFVANIDEDYARHGVQFDLQNVISRTHKPQDFSGAKQQDITISDYQHDPLPLSAMPRSPRLHLKDPHSSDYSLQKELGYNSGPDHSPWNLWTNMLDLEGESLGSLTLLLPCSRGGPENLRVCSIANIVWLIQKIPVNNTTHNRYQCLLVFVSLPDTSEGYGTMASVIVPLQVLYPELVDPWIQTYPGGTSPYLSRPSTLQALQNLASDEGERGNLFRSSANKPVLARRHHGGSTTGIGQQPSIMVRGSLRIEDWADEVVWEFDPEVTISSRLDNNDADIVRHGTVIYPSSASRDRVASTGAAGYSRSAEIPIDDGGGKDVGGGARQRTVVETVVGRRSTSLTGGLRRKNSWWLSVIEPLKCGAKVSDGEHN